MFLSNNMQTLVTLPSHVHCLFSIANKNMTIGSLRESTDLCDLVSKMNDINDAFIFWKNSFLGTAMDSVLMKKVMKRPMAYE